MRVVSCDGKSSFFWLLLLYFVDIIICVNSFAHVTLVIKRTLLLTTFKTQITITDGVFAGVSMLFEPISCNEHSQQVAKYLIVNEDDPYQLYQLGQLYECESPLCASLTSL